MPRPCRTVSVDDQLHWVVRVPSVPIGASRPSAPEQLDGLSRELEMARDRHSESWQHDAIVDAVAMTVLTILQEPPDLPFIGEPFGGEDGTD
jgi:hypothetical protein